MFLRPIFHCMTSEIIDLDLNDLASGKVELSSFQSKINSMDFSTYQGKHVRLSGCAPTWAHLLVAAKLFPLVSTLDFLLDDGKEGRPISLLTK